MFIVLGIVIGITFLVVGYLFFILDKEGYQKKDPDIVPLKDSELKKELSDQLSTPTATYLATEEIYKKRIHELEEELLVSSKKAQDQYSQSQQMVADLVKNNEEYHASHGSLTKEIESLRHELIKLKAQSAGYERISFNYKNQLEGLLKK